MPAVGLRSRVRRRLPLLPAVLLCLLAATSCAPQPAPPNIDIAPRLGLYAPLLPLFRALAAQEAYASATPLTILQIGDSHTANDSFSGRMREQFQARFGDGGRGILPPGVRIATTGRPASRSPRKAGASRAVSTPPPRDRLA